MPSIGLSDYVRVLALLPATAAQIAARMGFRASSTRLLMRRLWALKLTHPGSICKPALGATAEVVWLVGEGQAAPGVRRDCTPLRPHPQQIAFATLWRAMDGGATVPEIVDETGLSKQSAYRVISVARSVGLSHIAAYERTADNKPIAAHAAGPGRDASSPMDKRRRWRHERGVARDLYRHGLGVELLDVERLSRRSGRAGGG